MHMSLRRKLGFGFGIVVLLGAFSGGVTFYQLQRMKATEEQITRVRIPSVLSAEHISRAIADASFQYRNYIIWGEDPAAAAKYDKARQAAWKRLFDEIETLKKFDTGKDRETLSRLESDAGNGSLRIQEETISDVVGKGPEARRRALEKMSGGAALAAKVQADCTELAKSVQEALKHDDETLARARSATLTTVLIAGLLTALCGVLVAFLVSRQIASGMGSIVERIQTIGSGDLRGTERAVHSNDEMGQALGSLGDMQKSLRETISSISQNAETVASASEEIAASASVAREGATRQSDQATQVATAMQEMSSTVAQVSDNSNKAADSARRAATLAKRGGEVVKEALVTMRSIASSVSATAAKIEELGRSSEKIGRIVGVIDDIADQTNLLALNAAIEAARAGEQGRGFAVVADEVRKLAERTTKATKEIAQMIENVQRETGTAVAQMQDGTKQVQIGVETTSKAGASLEEIIAAAQQVGDMIAQIATAATQQTSTTELINSNVEQIARITHQSADGAEQAAKACEDLSTLALSLQQLVARFNLGQGDAKSQGASTWNRNCPTARPGKANRYDTVREYEDKESALVH